MVSQGAGWDGSVANHSGEALISPSWPLGNRIVVRVTVRDNNVDQALRVLKKKMLAEGMFRDMRRRESYEKPTTQRAREHREAVARELKRQKKAIEKFGF